MVRFAETRFWILLTAFALTGLAIQCGGPEPFRSHVGTGGHGGASSAGVGGAAASGAAGDGSAAGAAGTPPPLDGAAGDTGGADGGITTDGAAGAGAGGATGTAGAGAAGAGAAGAGGATGTAGTTGTAGAAGGGAAGAGAAGAGGKGGAAGAPDAGTDAAAPSGMLTVQYECRQNGPSVLQAEYSIKVVNTGTTDIPLGSVSVRYWYTIDGTGAQAGNCASASHPCTIAFQVASPAKPTADQVAVISFASGTLAKGTDTGEIQIQLGGTGNLNQTNDYSFADTGAVFTPEMHVTGYISGKLVWGVAP